MTDRTSYEYMRDLDAEPKSWPGVVIIGGIALLHASFFFGWWG